MPARLPNLRALILSGLFLASSPALAEQEGDCISSFETAQRLRKEGKLLAASEALITCSNPACQSFISKECTAWYTEVQTSLPTVAFSARKDGQLLRDVRIYVDGKLLSERSDGRSLPMDPGLHEFKFEVDGSPPVIVKELIIEGEKNKPIVGLFQTDPSPVEATTSTKIEAHPVPVSSAPPIGTYVLAGVGVLAIGGGVVLRVVGANEFDDFESSCKPRCDENEVDKTILKYTLSDVSFGVGAAALVGAGVLYFLHGSAEKAPATAITIAPSDRGASAYWVGRF